MIRMFAAVRATIIAGAFVAGVPLLLVEIGGSPLPDRAPSTAQLQTWLDDPLHPQYVPATARVVAWLIWALLASMIITVGALHARRWRWARLTVYLPGPVQGLAATLLGAATVTTAVGALPANAAAPATVSDTGPSRAATTAAHVAPAPTAAANHQGAADPVTAPRTVTVQRDDTLWDIAAARLGDPQDWRQIYRLNTSRYPHMRGGHHIEPGWTLTLPTRTAASDHRPRPGTVTTAPTRPDTTTSVPPDEGPTGPQPSAAAGPTAAAPCTAPPASGTGRQTGSPGSHEYPADHERATSPTTTHQQQAPASPRAADLTRSSATPLSSAASSPADDGRTRLCPAPTTGRSGGNAATATTPRGSQDAETTTPRAGRPGHAADNPMTAPTLHHSPTVPAGHHADGVPLPHGGWITLPLAASLAAAGAMVWLRRRHRYAPTQARPTTGDDRSLKPLPPVIAAINRAVRRQTPTLPDAAPAPLSVTDYTSLPEDARPDLPPVGPTGAVLSGIGDNDQGTGRGLTGPGAHCAARALLVATLSSGSPADPDAQGLAIVPADTLTALLDGAAQPADTPRLHMTANLPDALTHLEELLIERHRHLRDYDVADLTSLHAADPYHPPMPPVLLLATAPPEDLHARLRNILRLGAPLQIQAIMLGDWPHGATTSVQADGRAGTEQLAILDAATTLQLLAVLHEAHTGEPPSPTPTTPNESSDLAEDRADDSTDVDHPRGRTGTAATPGDATTDTTDTDAPPTGAPAPKPSTLSHRAGAVHQTAAGRVRIRLLGTPAINDGDNNPVAGLRHHARELLVYLAVHRDGADLPDIMEAIWPDATLRRAAQRLSTETADLRRRIRQAAGDTTIQPVVNTGGRYHLDPDLHDIDLWQFNDALHRARTADPDDHVAQLQQAVELHTGALAQGYDYEWIEPSREHLRRCGIRARLDLAELLAHHDPASATGLIRAAAAIDPINEDLARRAMRALAATGDNAGVRTVLQQLREALHDIDEDPSEETLTLATQLQRPTG